MLGKMLESFIFAFNAVTPMVMLIGLGYLIKQWGVFDANTERRLTKFLFNYALPCLMFINVYDMDGIRDLPFNLIGTAVAALFAVVGAGMLLAHFVAEQRNQKGVIIQMTYRSNYSVIGLSLASALYGAEGLRMGCHPHKTDIFPDHLRCQGQDFIFIGTSVYFPPGKFISRAAFRFQRYGNTPAEHLLQIFTA